MVVNPRSMAYARAAIRRRASSVLTRSRTPLFETWPETHGQSEMLFVLGSSRSGTHWLGHILDSHPDIRVAFEQPATFNYVTRMALAPHERYFTMPRLIEAYRSERANTEQRYFADKSHPALWIAEYLADAIPPARFIGIRRNPYQVVASMLLHSGVSQWPRRWREFPLPNRFLGINSAEEAETYERLSAAEQHALRWLSHSERMDQLHRDLGQRLLVLEYDVLQDDPAASTNAIQTFLELPTPFPAPNIKRDSRDKWREVLSQDDIESIERITGMEPPPTNKMH